MSNADVVSARDKSEVLERKAAPTGKPMRRRRRTKRTLIQAKQLSSMTRADDSGADLNLRVGHQVVCKFRS